MQRDSIVLWTAFAALGVVDLLWCRSIGLSFTNWLPFLAWTGGIGVVGAIYGATGRSARIAAMANGTSLWMIGSLFGAILTYAAATGAGALYDAQLAATDAAFGFHWTAWYRLVSDYPQLRLVLQLAYTSLLPQILLSVFWFSFIDRDDRNFELLGNFTVAILITAAVFHFVPALGPGVGVPAIRHAYIDELVALRSGNLTSADIMQLKGVVAFPSFHTVLALLFVYAHRRSRLLIPVGVLNALLLVSTPSEGGHYLVDLLAGGAIAGLAILATTALTRRRLTPVGHTQSVRQSSVSDAGRPGEISATPVAL